MLGGLLDRLRPDPKCDRCTRTYAACICTRAPAKAVKRQQPKVRTPKRR